MRAQRQALLFCTKAGALVVVLFASAGIYLYRASRPMAGHHLFLPPEFALGDALPDSSVVGHIPIRNVGTLPVTITSTAADCGCTDAKAPSLLLPGEAGVVDVTLHTAGDKRLVQKHVLLTSDDDQSRQKVVTISAYVHYEYAAEPPRVDLGTVSYADPLPSAVTLLWRSSDARRGTLRVTDLSPQLHVEAGPWSSGARDDYRKLTVSLTSVPGVGTYARDIMIDGGGTPVPLHVEYRVLPALKPTAMLIARTEGGTTELALPGPSVTKVNAVSEKGLVRPSLAQTAAGLLLRCVAQGDVGRTDNAYDSVRVSYTLAGTDRSESVVVPVVITR